MITMPGSFDPIPPNFSQVLKENCLQVVSLIAMVAENPAQNAHFVRECRELLDTIEGDLADVGLDGDGRSVPENKQLDVLDMLFLKGAEGLKKYFQQRMGSGEEYDDDER